MSASDQELPLLTEVADDIAGELPMLFEVIGDLYEPHAAPKPAPQHTLTATQMQQILQQFEIHLESVFTKKLNAQMEELQRLAVDMAVSEFRAELPALLRAALTQTNETGKS